MRIFDLFGPPNVEKMLAKKDVKGLIKTLRYKEPDIRIKATKALGNIAHYAASAVDPLIATLKDSNSNVRKAAAEALGKIGNERAEEPLIAALNDNDNDMLKEVTAALEKIRQIRIETLETALKCEDWRLRKSAIESLRETGDVYAVDPLIATLDKDVDGDVRKVAATMLGNLGDPRAVGMLISALRDPAENVRKAAIKSLEKINPDWPKSEETKTIANKIILDVKEAWREYRTAKNHNDSYQDKHILDATRSLSQSITVLGEIMSYWPKEEKLIIKTVPEFFLALGVEDNGLRIAVADALDKIYPDWATGAEFKSQVSELVSALRDPGQLVREMATGALWWKIADWPNSTEAKAQVPEFISALKDKDSKVREAAAKTLGIIVDYRAVEPLIAALKDGSVNVAEEATRALGEIGDTRAVDPLISAIQNKDIAEDTRDALCRIMEKSAAEINVNCLRSIAQLTDVTQIYSSPGCSYYGSHHQGKLDCSRLKQLARQELIRRGIEA